MWPPRDSIVQFWNACLIPINFYSFKKTLWPVSVLHFIYDRCLDFLPGRNYRGSLFRLPVEVITLLIPISTKSRIRVLELSFISHSVRQSVTYERKYWNDWLGVPKKLTSDPHQTPDCSPRGYLRDWDHYSLELHRTLVSITLCFILFKNWPITQYQGQLDLGVSLKKMASSVTLGWKGNFPISGFRSRPQWAVGFVIFLNCIIFLLIWYQI